MNAKGLKGVYTLKANLNMLGSFLCINMGINLILENMDLFLSSLTFTHFVGKKKWRIIELIILPFEAQEKGRGPGRPRELSKRQERVFLRCITNLRKEDGNFTVKRLMERADLNISLVSCRTVQRFLHSNGYRYLNSRKKGVLLNAVFKKRLQFAKKMKTEFHDNVWTEDIAFYLDGVSLIHKYHPLDQARAPRGKIWPKPQEGLAPFCTEKDRTADQEGV